MNYFRQKRSEKAEKTMDHKRNADLHSRKNKLLKKCIKTGDQLTCCRYKTYRENLNHLNRKSKKKRYIQYFFDAKDDMKNM